MTLISAVTIGIPSFVLALEPNREKIKGNLFTNIVNKSIPAALTVICCLMACVGTYMLFDIPMERYSTLTVVSTGIIGIMLIYNISVPFNSLRKTLFYSVIALLFIGISYFSSLLQLEPLNFMNISILIVITLASKIIYDSLSKINFEKYIKKQ